MKTKQKKYNNHKITTNYPDWGTFVNAFKQSLIIDKMYTTYFYFVLTLTYSFILAIICMFPLNILWMTDTATEAGWVYFMLKHCWCRNILKVKSLPQFVKLGRKVIRGDLGRGQGWRRQSGWWTLSGTRRGGRLYIERVHEDKARTSVKKNEEARGHTI